MADLAPPDDLFAPPPDDVFNDAGPTVMHNRGMPTPPPAQPPSIWKRFLDATHSPGHGTAGGMAGGIAGGMLSGGNPAGMAVGGAVGNAIGQRLQVGADEAYAPLAEQSPEVQAFHAKWGTWPLEGVKPAPPRETNDSAALFDGATQGLTALAFKPLGTLAAKAGFPRVAAALGAKAPQQAVVDAAPAAVKQVSTPALQAVDAAGIVGDDTAKEIAAISAEQARRDAVLAVERQKAEQAIAPIQQRMAGRVPGLAEKTKGFSDKIREVVPPEKWDKAFASAPEVMEAAESTPVMQARSAMVQEAVPQTVDNQALKLARRPMAAAEARGVTSGPAQHAADAAGLRELGGNIGADNAYLTRVMNRVPGVGTAMQLLPKGGMTPQRVTQTTAAVLGSRGAPTINPAVAKLLADNLAYRTAAPAEATAETLRAFLAALSERKSQP